MHGNLVSVDLNLLVIFQVIMDERSVSAAGKRIGFLGLTFKPATDDMARYRTALGALHDATGVPDAALPSAHGKVLAVAWITPAACVSS